MVIELTTADLPTTTGIKNALRVNRFNYVTAAEFCVDIGEQYCVDTTTFSSRATLPQNPPDGACVIFTDAEDTWTTNSFRLDPWDKTINGLSGIQSFQTPATYLFCVYLDVLNGWRVYSTLGLQSSIQSLSAHSILLDSQILELSGHGQILDSQILTLSTDVFSLSSHDVLTDEKITALSAVIDNKDTIRDYIIDDISGFIPYPQNKAYPIITCSSYALSVVNISAVWTTPSGGTWTLSPSSGGVVNQNGTLTLTVTNASISSRDLGFTIKTLRSKTDFAV